MSTIPLTAILALRRRLEIAGEDTHLLFLEGRLPQDVVRQTRRHIVFVFDLSDSCPVDDTYLAALQALATTVAQYCSRDVFSAWVLGTPAALQQARPMAETATLRHALQARVPVARQTGTKLLPLWAQLWPDVQCSHQRGEEVVLLVVTDGEIWDLAEFTAALPAATSLPRTGVIWVDAAAEQRPRFWPGASYWTLGDAAAQGACLRQLLAVAEDGPEAESAAVTVTYTPAISLELVMDLPETGLPHPRVLAGAPRGSLEWSVALESGCFRTVLVSGGQEALAVRGRLAVYFCDRTATVGEMTCQEVSTLAWEASVLTPIQEEVTTRRHAAQQWKWDEDLIAKLEHCKYRKGRKVQVKCIKCGLPRDLNRSYCSTDNQILLHRTRRERQQRPLHDVLGLLLPLTSYNPDNLPTVVGGVGAAPELMSSPYQLPGGLTLVAFSSGWQLTSETQAGKVNINGVPCLEPSIVETYDFIEVSECGQRYLFLDLRF